LAQTFDPRAGGTTGFSVLGEPDTPARVKPEVWSGLFSAALGE